MARAPLVHKLLLALLSPLALLVVLEAALYLAAFRYHPLEAPILIWNPIEDRGLANQAGLFQVDADTLWSPRPEASIPWGRRERVNRAGFRGPLLPREREPGVLRVAALGDSSTFGMGVAQEETYSAQLERLLRDEGLAAEVLNAGVVGFTIRQGLERYRHHVRPYRPDLVLAAFGAVNEHHMAIGLPDDLKIARSQRKDGPLGRSWRWAKRNLHVLQLLSYLDYQARGGIEGERGRSLARYRREAELVHSAGRPDFEGARRVPLGRYEELIAELAREVERDGAQLVVLSLPRRQEMEASLPVLLHYSEATREAALGAGLLHCDGRRAFHEAVPAGGKDDFLFVAGDPIHPNALGHGILARELAPLVQVAARRGRP